MASMRIAWTRMTAILRTRARIAVEISFGMATGIGGETQDPETTIVAVAVAGVFTATTSLIDEGVIATEAQETDITDFEW